MKLDNLSSLAKRTGFALFFLLIVLLTFASVLNLRLLVDTQQLHCMPFTVAIARYGDVGQVKTGDILAFTPGDRMGPLFKDKIIVKQVSAIKGDVVSVRSDKLLINGVVFGEMDIKDASARYLRRKSPFLDKDVVIQNGEILMLGTLPRSFDGRYWGALPVSQLIGRVYPIM